MQSGHENPSKISPLERSEAERKGPRAPEAKLGKRNSGFKASRILFLE